MDEIRQFQICTNKHETPLVLNLASYPDPCSGFGTKVLLFVYTLTYEPVGGF